MERISGEFIITETSELIQWFPRVKTNRAEKYPVWENPKTYRRYVLYDRAGRKWTWNKWGNDDRIQEGTILKMIGFKKGESKLTRMKILAITP